MTMLTLCKVCDATDWFDPTLTTIIRHELEDEPVLHRKQWEFAVIFSALTRLGCLHPRSRGLSMGSGRERLLYAVARRVAHLTVTDLYSPTASWATARVQDALDALLAEAPFAVDPRRLSVERMDMRTLEYPDSSFDFCYSACAVEHIGGRDALIQHLREASRVLRPNGIYAFTTEFHFGPELVDDPENPLFPAELLTKVVADTPFTPESIVDARLAAHPLNEPVAANLRTAFLFDAIGQGLASRAPHITLLRGHHAFTSVLLVLRKRSGGDPPPPLVWQGLEVSRGWIDRCVQHQRAAIEAGPVELNPFAYLDESADALCSPTSGGTMTAIHTDYVWLGGGKRRFVMRWEVEHAQEYAYQVEVRIQRQSVLAGGVTATVEEHHLSVTGGVDWTAVIDVDTNAQFAVLARTTGARPAILRVCVTSAPA
jgi:SAM-dependent methyltransferase